MAYSDYTLIHVNDVRVERIKEIIPDVKSDEYGDCGSVWAERHDEQGVLGGLRECPFPHVILTVYRGTDVKPILECLEKEGIGYVYTGYNYSDVMRQSHWKEDRKCLERTKVKDFRKRTKR